jgi:hypothetical protein
MYQVDTMDAEERKKEDDGYVQAIELQLLHDQKLSAWAWGTGMAEQHQGDAREEAWENHGEDETANYIRRKDILKKVGVIPQKHDIVDIGFLLQYHLWPGPRDMDMGPVAIMGSEQEARLMNEHRLFEDAEDPKVRMGYLKEMCRTMQQIGKDLQDGMNKHDVRMHQDVRFWWDENQRHGVWILLEDKLMELAEDPQSEVLDRSTFMEIYNWNIQSYLERTGPYVMPSYDEEDARKSHMQHFDFFGQEAETVASRLADGPVRLYTGAILCDKVDPARMEEYQQKQYKKTVGKLMFEAKPFGNKHSPTDRVEMLKKLGKGLVPDWVAPPEGIQEDAGKQLGNGEHESGGGLDGEYNTR